MNQTLKNKINKINSIRNIKDVFFLLFGIIMATIGLKGFLLPNYFLDGGAMGVSLLLNHVTQIELSYFIILVNIPFIVIGAKQISIKFAVKSIFAIVLLAVLVHFVSIPALTDDKLLIAIFGGFFLGAGIGLSIRGGAVIDGTEVLAIQVSRKTSLSVGDFITIFNVLLFSIAIFITDIETAMYSMLIYFSASKTVDFILNGIEEYIGVMIVSQYHRELKLHITHQLGKGVTVLKSGKGFVDTDEKQNILYCVVTRLEVTKLLTEIQKIDANAFIIQHPVKDTKGGMIKKRPLH